MHPSSAPRSNESRPETPASRVLSAIFGERYVPGPFKLIVLFGVLGALTFVLLASDPWTIFRFVPYRLRPETDLPDRIPDKVYHFTGYLSLALVCMWYSVSRSKLLIASLVLLMLGHAATTEYMQGFVPDRTTDISDFVANSCGIMLGLAIGLFCRRFVLREDPEPVLWLGAHALPVPEESRTVRPVMQRSFAANAEAASADNAGQMGFARNQLTDDEIASLKVRDINYRFLGISCVTAIVMVVGMHSAHGFLVKRNAGSLLTLAQQSRETGELVKAGEFYRRYVALVPSNMSAMTEYAVLLDDTRKGTKSAKFVFDILENTLRVDPTRDDLRHRQVRLAVEMGRYTDAIAHVKVLRQAHPTDGALDLRAGQCLEQVGEFDEAVVAYERAIANEPELVEAYRCLALLQHLRLDQPEAATKLLDTLVEQNAKDPAAYVARARFRQEIHRYETAVADIEVAIGLAPESVDVLLAAADLNYARAARARSDGRTALVERIFLQTKTLLTDGLGKYPNNLDLQLRLMQLESHLGNSDAALQQLVVIAGEHPKDARVHMLLADVSIERGDFKKARSSIELLPRTPQADALRLFLRGRIEMAEKSFDAAVASMSEARRYLADSPELLERVDLALAQCSAALGQVEGELDCYRNILKHSPASLTGRLGLAGAFTKAGRISEAIAEYHQLKHLPAVRLQLARLLIVRNLKLTEIDRDWREIEVLLDDVRVQGDHPIEETMLRAEVLAGRGQFDDARQLLEQARTTQADRVEFLVALSKVCDRSGDERQAALWLGQAYDAAGRNEQAEEQLKRAVAISPRDTAAKLALMQFYLRRGRQADAVSLFQGFAAKLNRRELARAYASFGDLGRAVVLLQQDLKERPEDVDSLQSLADVYLRSGHERRAEPHLRKIIGLNARAPESAVKKARRQLAVMLAAAGDYAKHREAVSLLDANIGEARPSPEDMRAKAAVLSTQSAPADRQTAIRLLEQLDDQGLLLVKDRWLLGRLYDADGNAPQAAIQLERVLAAGSNSAAYLREYVDHHIEHRAFEVAAKWLTRLQELAPQDPETVVRAARLQAAQGQHDAATATLRAFVSAATTPPQRLSRLASAASAADDLARRWEGEAPAEPRTTNSNGSAGASPSRSSSAGASPSRSSNAPSEVAAAYLKTAEALHREAIAIDPAAVQSLVDWQLRHGRANDAFEQLDACWKSLPPEAAAGMSLAVLGSQKNAGTKTGAVEKPLQAALASNPKSLMLKVCLADLRSLQGQADEAQQLYQSVLDVDRDNVPALNNLAWNWAFRGVHVDDAMVLIERAILVAGPAPQLIDTRACVLLAQHSLGRAAAELKTVLAAEDSATVLLHLAAVQAEAGELTAAQATWERAKKLKLDPSLLHPLERVMYASVAKRLVPPVAVERP